MIFPVKTQHLVVGIIIIKGRRHVMAIRHRFRRDPFFRMAISYLYGRTISAIVSIPIIFRRTVAIN